MSASKPLRIAIDASRTTRAQRTGTENYALQLIRALLDLDSVNQYTLYFRDTPQPGLFPPKPNVTAKVIPFPRLWTHIRFAAELFRDRPDITFVPAHTLPILFPGRSIVTIHDLGYRPFPEAHPRFSRLYLEYFTRYSAARASLIIADSQATATDLQKFYGTKADKIRVVYPGVERLQRATPDHISAVREKYKLPERYLLFLGTLQPRKNINRLIDAFQQWKLKNPNEQVGLVLAGRKGWLSDSLKLDTSGVIVTGYVDNADIAALYSGALALVFPSLYEGFGFPVIEAMNCGTPVLTSNTSSLPELAADAALTVDPLNVNAIAEGITRLIDDSTLRGELVKRGLRNAERFTWKAAAEGILRAFNAL